MPDDNRRQTQISLPRSSLTIGVRLLLSFLAVVLTVTLLPTAASVIIQNQVSANSTFQNLATIGTLKESEITLWQNLLKTNLIATENNSDFLTNASSILKNYSPLTPDKPALLDKPAHLSSSFIYLISQNQVFTDLVLFDLRGNVYVTTLPTPSNFDLINDEWNYISRGSLTSFASYLFVTKSASAPAAVTLVTSIPVYDSDGTLIGILAGQANLFYLGNILAEKENLGATGQSYLVDRNGTILTEPQHNPNQKHIGTTLAPQDFIGLQALQAGSGVYTNYAGRQVFRAFVWVPSLQAYLFVDQQQSEALAITNEPILVNVLAAVLALILAITSAVFITRSITSPITKLVQVAKQIAGGNLDVRVKDIRQVELGLLGQTINSMTDQLQSSISNLEKTVLERTEALQHRSIQIQVASEIARDATQATNPEDVLNRAVNLIRDKFGFYHAGIFLIDNSHNFAELKAATGEAGHILLARNHKLQIGELGLVPAAASQGQPKLSMDVDADNTYYRNPLLPLTKSELAIPMKTGDQVIGVLDVQSMEISAFNQDDVTIFQTMADQLAVAIEKTILLQQYQENLDELSLTYQQYTQKGWSDFIAQSRRDYSFRLMKSKIESTSEKAPEAIKALELNATVITENIQGDPENPNGFSSLAVPIKLRGQNLGALTIKFQSRQINQEVRKLIEIISDRLALALENARLLEQIQRQAERDHIASEITTRIHASNDVNLILQTAIQELGRSLGVSKAFIQLRSLEEENISPRKNDFDLSRRTGAAKPKEVA